MSWNDFGNAEVQEDYGEIIPHRTPAKVIMKIKPGGYNDEANGWTGDYATQADSGAIYLNCEFTIMGGKYNKRKVFSLVGLHSPKGPKWAAMGRAFIRAALESARGINPEDTSEKAMSARRISGFGDLNGLEFAARIEVQKAEAGSGYDDKNVIQTVIPVTHKDYRPVMDGAPPAEQAAAAQSASAGGAPAWLNS